MANFIIIVILVGVILSILCYLYKAKKRGETCIGCPYSKQCSESCKSESVSEQPENKMNHK